jgi:NADH dehydrogenase
MNWKSLRLFRFPALLNHFNMSTPNTLSVEDKVRRATGKASPTNAGPAADARPHIVVIGAGFGGLNLVQGLAKAPVRITIIDRQNHHVFQPLLYQVATSALAVGDIAAPIRTVLRKQKNVTVLMDEVIDIDRNDQTIETRSARRLTYDYLVVATGNQPTYFGRDEWRVNAPGLKTLSDALVIRQRLLFSFEQAHMCADPAERASWLTHVIVGGGPTGVEMAGSIAEIGRKNIAADYPCIQPEDLRVILIEGSDSLLNGYHPSLSQYTREALTTMGVEVITGTRVQNVTATEVQTADLTIGTRNVIWAAGNQASPLVRTLDTQTDRSGRAIVRPDCSLMDDERVFVIGDAAAFATPDGGTLPGVAQVAIQQGQYLARILGQGLPANWRKPFRYFDKGNMATIGRARAVLETGPLRLTGLPAWGAWAVVHVLYLVTYRNRFRVFMEWLWLYVAFKPGSRILYRSGRAADTQTQSSPVLRVSKPAAPLSHTAPATHQAVAPIATVTP